MPQCKALTNQIHYNIDGNFLPCCAFDTELVFPVSEYTPIEFLTSPFMHDIRNEMQTGWHNGCIICKRNEDANKFSLRQHYNLWCRQNDVIEFLDLSLNNTCNLTCRMCDEISSSKWAEIKQTVGHRHNFADIINHLPDIKYIKYVGGEPFITPEVKDIIDYAAEKHITLTVNTNGTFFPYKHLNKLKLTKSLNVGVSIDGYQYTNDYIRNGSNFEQISKVMAEWINFYKEHKGILSIDTTVQAYNLHDLSNIKLYANTIGVQWLPQLLEKPMHYNINALPEKYIDEILDETNTQFVKNYKFDELAWNALCSQTKLNDTLFNKNIADYNPILHKYINGEA